MFCRNCGSIIEERDKFCPNCGTRNDQWREEVQNNNGVQLTPKGKKKIAPFIIIPVVLLVLIAIGVTIYAFSPSQKLKKQLSLGERYLEELNFEQAEVAYKAALVIDPNDELAKAGLLQTYICWAESLLSQGNTEDAIEQYENAISIDAANLEIYQELLKLYFDLEDIDAIVALYKQAEASLSADDLGLFKDSIFVIMQDMLNKRLDANDLDGVEAILNAAKTIDITLLRNIVQETIDNRLADEELESAISLINLAKKADVEVSEESYLKLIDFYLDKGDYDNAEEMIKFGEAGAGTVSVAEKWKELPYALVNNISLSENVIREITYDDYCMTLVDSNGYQLKHDGLSVDKGDSVLTIESITVTPSDNSTKTITIETSNRIKPHYKSPYSLDWWYVVEVKGIGMFDYYSGTVIDDKNTSWGDVSAEAKTIIEWKEQKYEMSDTEVVTWDEETTPISSEVDSFENELYKCCNHTYIVTVPADYDGLVIAIKKSAGDCTKEDDYYTEEKKQERSKKEEEYYAQSHVFLEADENGDVPDLENCYFIRLTDEMIAKYNEN